MKHIEFLRLEKQILKLLSFFLRTEIADPRLKLATFTTVKLAGDHSQVKVYVDTLDRKQTDALVTKLNKISGLFRSALAKKLELSKSPKIIFVNDIVIDKSSEIEKLITQELKKIKSK